MADSTLALLTAKTAGQAALLYGAVSPYAAGDDRKVAMTAAGAVLLEAADAAAQRTALGLTSASQAEMEAGTEANLRSMSPLRIAQAIAALGGGVGITMSGIAFVDATAGNNGTAVIGNPATPYLTAQAAVDDGATKLHVVGSVGNITKSGALTLHLIGLGREVSIVGTITATGDIVLTGNGWQNIAVGDVTTSAANGTNGADGVSVGEQGGAGNSGGAAYGITCKGLYLQSVQSLAGDAGAGGTGGPGDEVTPSGSGGTGGVGGAGAPITLEGCNYEEVIATGGAGGYGASAGAGGGGGNGSAGDGGNGGDGGVLTLSYCVGRSPTSTAGGSGGGGPGTPGANGTIGSTTVRSSDVGTLYNTTSTIIGTIIDGVFTAS